MHNFSIQQILTSTKKISSVIFDKLLTYTMKLKYWNGIGLRIPTNMKTFILVLLNVKVRPFKGWWNPRKSKIKTAEYLALAKSNNIFHTEIICVYNVTVRFVINILLKNILKLHKLVASRIMQINAQIHR